MATEQALKKNEQSELYFHCLRILRTSILVVVFITLGSLSVFAATTGTITDNGVNIRAGAAKTAKVLGQAKLGQAVTITGTEGDFYHVFFDGFPDAYVAKQFVKEKAKAEAKTPAKATQTLATGTPAKAVSTVKTDSSADVEVKGKISGENINLRSSASKSGKVLGKAQKGEVYNVLAKQDTWYKVLYKGSEAFVFADFIAVYTVPVVKNALPVKDVSTVEASDSIVEALQSTAENMPIVQGAANQPEAVQIIKEASGEAVDVVEADVIYAVVTAQNGLYLREKASHEANILNALAAGEVADVLSIESDWINVSYAGQEGYVFAEYVTIDRGSKPNFVFAESENPIVNEIISYAKQFIGTPYSWGGTDLQKGVDCSGFVYSVMKAYGTTLNRSSSDMIKNGPIVQRSQLLPGDLIFFDTEGSNNGQISHVGIYIGNGKFIHSSSAPRAWGITISNLEDDYYTARYVAANRVL